LPDPATDRLGTCLYNTIDIGIAWRPGAGHSVGPGSGVGF